MGEISNPSEFIFDLIKQYKVPLFFASIGVVLVIIGIGLFFRSNKSEVEFVTQESTASGVMREIVVDVSGAVNDPGVYRLNIDSRVSDAILAAGDVSDDADRDWITKNINLASKISDGAKIYIPKSGEQGEGVVSGLSAGGAVNSQGKINVNTASAGELDTLYGVGPATAAKIIDNRPYASIEELVSKEALTESRLEKIKDKITVY